MFDEVMRQEGGRNAARRAGYVFGSTVFQGIVVVAIVFASTYIKAAVEDDEKVVDVKFVKAAAPPPPPPPPAAPPPARKRPPDAKPRTDLPKPPPPQALVQPTEIQEEMKPPDPSEPPEPEYDYGDSAGGEGVVGGVVGGAAPAAEPQIEDAPAWATSGYVKPRMAEAGCVQNAIRVPRGLEGFVSAVAVKFAIMRDGSPAQFSVLTEVPDRRIADAVWKAIQECKWIPGTDAQGKPTAIWVNLPIRFKS